MAVAPVISVTSPTVSDLDIFESRIDDGVRESARSWRDLLLDLRCHGLIQGRSRATPAWGISATAAAIRATTGRGFVDRPSHENHVDDDGEDRRRFRFRQQRLHLAWAWWLFFEASSRSKL